jgi:surface protein
MAIKNADSDELSRATQAVQQSRSGRVLGGGQWLRRVVGVVVGAVLLSVAGPWALPPMSGEVSAEGPPVGRTAGPDRYATALEVAREVGGGSLTGLDRIILVTGEVFPDALVASGLAGYLDRCPSGVAICGRTAILLTKTDSLPTEVADAIRSSGVASADVMVVGGPSAVSDQVHAAIGQATGWSGSGENPVARIYGETRYETATAVVEHVRSESDSTLPSSYKTVLVANGETFPDALSGGALAYRNGHLMLLSRPPSVPDVAREAIGDIAATCAVLLGGPEALAPTVGTQVNTSLVPGGCGLDRIGGEDRYETASMIADRMKALNGPATTVLLASGVDSADALVAAPLARSNAPILFAGANELPEATADWLRTNRDSINQIRLIGGDEAIPPAVANAAVLAADRPASSSGSGSSGDGTGSGAAPQPDFILEIQTTDSSREMVLPLRGSLIDPAAPFGAHNDDVNVNIDWGDGGVNGCPTTSAVSGNVSCTYTATAKYMITISKGEGATDSALPGFGQPFGYTGVNLITKVLSFGELGITSLFFAFAGSMNPSMPKTFPATVTSVRDMFHEAVNFNQNLSSWDMSNVENMAGMFDRARNFNNGCEPGVTTCPLNWKTPKVTDMQRVFNFANVFNQDISGWNTANVTNMSSMFNDAQVFNQNISGWNTASVSSMSNMFANASVFNQPIGNWNTAQVTDMEQMFYLATAFNQPIGNWNTSKVIVMRNMFNEATAFNQPIGNWNVSNVLPVLGAEYANGNGMQGMFNRAFAFNQNLSTWCVSQFSGRPANFNTNANSAWRNDGALEPNWGASCPAPS